MTKMTYGEQLKHPFWQRKRLQILDRDGWACTRCSSAEKTLHVHHTVYIKGRMVWEYDDSDLMTLCEDCHAALHEGEQEIKRLLATGSAGEMAALYRGYQSVCIEPETKRALYESDPIAFAGYIASIASLLDFADAAKVESLANELFMASVRGFDDALQGSDL